MFNKIVSIETCYGLRCPGFEPRGRRILPQVSRPALGLTQSLVRSYQFSFPAIKRPGRGVNFSPPSRGEVEERIEQYFYSTFVSSWPVIAQILPFLFCVHLISKAKFMVPTAVLVVQTFWNVRVTLLLHLGYPGFSEGYNLKLEAWGSVVVKALPY